MKLQRVSGFSFRRKVGVRVSEANSIGLSIVHETGEILFRVPQRFRHSMPRDEHGSHNLSTLDHAIDQDNIRIGLTRPQIWQVLLLDGAGCFLNRNDLIGADIEYHVDGSTGPENLQSFRTRRLAHTEMNARVVLRQIA